MNILEPPIAFALWQSALTLLISCFGVTIVLWLLSWFFSDELTISKRHFLILMLSVSILGGVAGYAGGLSRVGVVGEIIPAALSLVGGVVVYVFGVNQSKGATVAVLVTAFALSLFVNYGVSAKLRQPGEKLQQRLEICTKLFADSQLYQNKDVLKLADDRFWNMCGPTFLQLYPKH